MEPREVDDDAQSGAAINNQFIGRASVAAQVAVRMLHDATEAFNHVGLWLLHKRYVIGEAGDGQVHHN